MKDNQEGSKTPVTVAFEDNVISLVEKIAKNNFCNRSDFIRRGTFELLEKLAPKETSELVKNKSIN